MGGRDDRSRWVYARPGSPDRERPFFGKVLDRVVERHTVRLQEPVDGVARGEVEHLAELVLRQAAHPIRVDDQGVKGGFRQILARRGHAVAERVREVQPDAHEPTIGRAVDCSQAGRCPVDVDSVPPRPARPGQDGLHDNQCLDTPPVLRLHTGGRVEGRRWLDVARAVWHYSSTHLIVCLCLPRHVRRH